MENLELEPESESIERAVELLDHLLIVADGGRGVVMEQYEATTILALLIDKPYRVKVMSRFDIFAQAGAED